MKHIDPASQPKWGQSPATVSRRVNAILSRLGPPETTEPYRAQPARRLMVNANESYSHAMAATGRRKTTGRKTTGRKTTGRKTTGRKTTARRTTARKTTGRKTAGRKTAARKTTARKTTGRKTTARKTTGRKSSTGRGSVARKSHRGHPAGSGRASGSRFRAAAGEITPISADKYICPEECGWEWHRQRVGKRIPKCPEHDVTLVRAH